MTDQIAVWGLGALAMSSGLVAGVFLTFSDFVMRALALSSPAAGTEAMQLINRTVYRSAFMVLLIGLTLVSAVLAAGAALSMSGPVATALMLAGVIYVGGVFGVTVFGNVPMNQRLDAMPQGGAAAQDYWPAYVRGWVRWNHLRWISALAAAAAYGAAAVLLARAA